MNHSQLWNTLVIPSVISFCFLPAALVAMVPDSQRLQLPDVEAAAVYSAVFIRGEIGPSLY